MPAQARKRQTVRRTAKRDNVYDAAVKRIDFIFKNFDRVVVSFSGGKDSGVLLNLVVDYMRANNITKKVGVQIMDNEANYEYSLQFMKRIIEKNRDIFEVYWCCLPITLPCSVSSYDVEWQAWGEKDRHKWIRPRPDDDYVVHFQNHPFGEAFEENATYDEFWDMFSEWFAGGKSCANLIGIRAAESLNRFRAIMNERKETFQGHMWTKKNSKHVYNCYPIYDWRNEDVWTANARMGWDYNKLYDVFYMAGIPISKMRVASPFMSEAKSSLGMYRVIDPNVWAKLCARVHGANFVATYGKQLNYRTFKLPEGHTWKSFVKFLLATLPEQSAENFKTRFIQGLKFWGRVGRGLPDSVIEELTRLGIRFSINGTTPHGNGTLRRVCIRVPPDHMDELSAHPSMVHSWKRFAVTILKNDHTCKYLGLAPTRYYVERQREIQAKYGVLSREKMK